MTIAEKIPSDKFLGIEKKLSSLNVSFSFKFKYLYIYKNAESSNEWKKVFRFELS